MTSIEFIKYTFFQNQFKRIIKLHIKSQKEKIEHLGSPQITEETIVSLDGISSKLVAEPENNVIVLNGNITKLVLFNLEGYKGYLYYGFGKTVKKKKTIKKIINSNNGKRRTSYKLN
ncbi:hypothetical protein YYG_03835 [Plasmodium vinckei petteri]|uniref:Uncharacterized protein n=1 Tax=Plasmodium vinckei petteri TaxID=138298 RepID=W7AD46_PLAVN|nr:hypothetical protein YYG_03835 [Plasmodium vinckei petteri]